MSKKHKLDASHPGVGKSKIMKKLAKKLKRKYVDVKVLTPTAWYGIPFGVGKSAIMLDDVKPNPAEPADHWLVEDLDTNATCWDDQMDEMCRDFHTLRDRLAYVKDNDRLKLVDELLHRVIEVRCQLDTMKKEQGK
jgi:broad-specificity NMP kinase